VVTMRPGETQVFNIVNAGNDAFYTCLLVDLADPTKNIELQTVAGDGIGFSTVGNPQQTPPSELQLLSFPPGRRFSFLVQGTTAKAGDTWELQTIGFSSTDTATNTWPAATLMTIKFQGTPVTSPTFKRGDPLTPPGDGYEDLRGDSVPIAAHRTVVFGED